MKRTWHVWLLFAVSLAVVGAALGWLSLTILRLDQAEVSARQQAQLEANVRLALWRMDSALSPLVGQESARPYFAYGTFLPVDRAWGSMFHRSTQREMLVPSPLLQEAAPQILVHFQFEPDGRLTSPRAPGPSVYRLAVPRYLSEQAVLRTKAQLQEVATLVGPLLEQLPQHATEPVEAVMSPPNPGADGNKLTQRSSPRRSRGSTEFEMRNQAVAQNANMMAQQQAAPFEGPLASTDLSGVLMTPLWVRGRLILARRIAVDGKPYVQGCLLDWPAIKASLLESAADLLPAAELLPAPAAQPEKETRMLAALPVRLIPGPVAAVAVRGLSPVRLTLWIAWGAALLAALAVAMLLGGVVRLSQRRAAFVSAVTHELRTPLTTFHMYTEMLSEGMVPDATKRQQYLDTLRTEAARLTHLVENVLAYARLERGRPLGRLEELTLSQLLGPIEGRLADRARQAGMELTVQRDAATGEAIVRANPSAVEQILFNLVDNACKYAATAADRRIHLSAEQADGFVRLAIRDHGPGVSPSASRRLFRSFGKSAHEAAATAPGVGLGLALSRRLARDTGARLELDRRNTGGARFVLRLPAVEGRPR